MTPTAVSSYAFDFTTFLSFFNEAVDLLLVLLYRDLTSHPSDWEIISAKNLTALTPTHSPHLPCAYGLCGLANVQILLQGKCWSHSSAGIIYCKENDTKTQTQVMCTFFSLA